MKINFLACFFFSLLLSCSYVQPDYQQQESVSVDGWLSTSKLTYQFQINESDTLQWYNLQLDIRNRIDYSFANVYLFITTTAPKGGISVDTINCILAQADGSWLGKGDFSKYRSIRIPFLKSVRFTTPGQYTVEIRHGMRQDPLVGMSNIGLYLFKDNQ